MKKKEPEKKDWRTRSYKTGAQILTDCVLWLTHLFERIFRRVSHITLIILSDLTSDFMRRFADTAPGTYQHALQVSNLAVEAAKRIDADELLVRVGALYHDIGKMKNPSFFIENQTEDNPLLRMNNAEAAQAIIQHTKDGERIAREQNLPEAIIDMITTHHGTSLVKYFYNSAINQSDTDNVNEADFRYPGPKPKTREAAILMMADVVEARSRCLDELTLSNISTMVDTMINSLVDDGQLSESSLRFRDIKLIKQAFKERLEHMHHHRIQYPTIHA